MIHYALYPDPAESVDLSASTSQVVEDVNALTLTCTVPAGHEGNPDVYTYYWTNIDTGYSRDTSNAQLTVTKTDLDATQHDGTWRCKAENEGGESPVDDMDVNVNGNKRIIYNS